MSPHRDRMAAHVEVSAALNALSDRDLAELVSDGDHRRIGIGGSTQAVRVAGKDVFAKIVRVTDVERAAGPRCTQNLFALPTWYQYGVGEGSTGYNVWREVAAHQMASGWVQGDECANFPLLHHWRELPQNLGETAFNPLDIDRAVQFWGASGAVRTRLEALTSSSTVVVLFLEQIPFVLRRWLTGQLTAGPQQAEHAVTLVDEQLLGAAGHLRSRGLSHFDAHFDNVLTDGNRLYLSDFGLATSRDFQLDAAERDFFAFTADHDLAYCAAALVNTIAGRLGFAGPRERNDFLRHCSVTGQAGDLTGLLGDTVVRYASIATIVNDFYWKLHDGELAANYPAGPIASALDQAGLTP